jgi:acyl carrier protein phosphodiesterase
MNHIAHFLLAPHTAEGAVGTLLADFYRGPISSALPEEIVAAIALHRAIDSHTDQHEATRDAKSLFATGLRRYAGVALDLYFDHCLAREWEHYASVPFAAFVGATYERLTGGLAAVYVPDRMRRMARAMRTDDWLGAYQDFNGVEQALGRLNHAIRHRFGREVDLLPLAYELRRLRPQLDIAFSVLFPDVVRRAEKRLP